MNTLAEDINTPLKKINRAWLRRIALYLVFVQMILPFLRNFGVVNGTSGLYNWLKKYW